MRLLPSRGPSADRYLDRPHTSTQLILLAGLGLLAFGVMMATSTTISASLQDGSRQPMWTQLIKEIEFIALGIPVFWVAARLSPRSYRFLTYPMMFLALVALFGVLVPGIGAQINGARRWIDIGPLQLQPSEFAKVAILLWSADLLARKEHLRTLTRARHLFVPLVPVFMLVCALVMLEPDLGTTMCFLLILLGVLWTVGMPFRYFSAVLGAVVGAVLLLAVSAPYRLERLTTFANPFKDAKGAGYHTVEGLYALASGGIFGVGLGEGTSKYAWVPNANTDYVFAVIGEELGLLGCLCVLLLFGLLAYAGLRISRRSADPFVRLVAGGATVWLSGQALINIGYVVGLLPVTGIPLPFISAGGSSLLLTAFVLGMLVSFARHEPAAVAATIQAVRDGKRSRLARWCRIPAPTPYVAPKRRTAPAANRPATKAPKKPAKQPQPVRQPQPARQPRPAAAAARFPRAAPVGRFPRAGVARFPTPSPAAASARAAKARASSGTRMRPTGTDTARAVR